MNAVPHNRWIHRCATLTTGAAFLTIAAGGMVTSTGSGLADPAWPLSRPNLIGGLLFEHGHRLIAATLGLLTLALTLALIFREPRPWVRRLGLLAFAIVACQGLLGRMTVLLGISAATSIAHAGLAEIFFCVMVILTMVTSPHWTGSVPNLPRAAGQSLARWAGATVWVVFFQILLGAYSRHTGSSYAIHVVGAFVVTAFVVATMIQAFSAGGDRTVTWPAVGMGAALVAQLALGPLSLILTPGKVVSPTPLPLSTAVPVTLHVVVGALMLIASLMLAVSVYPFVGARCNVPLHDEWSTQQI